MDLWKELKCVANFDKRTKIKVQLSIPACMIYFCCDQVVTLPMPLKYRQHCAANCSKKLKVSERLM